MCSSGAGQLVSWSTSVSWCLGLGLGAPATLHPRSPALLLRLPGETCVRLGLREVKSQAQCLGSSATGLDLETKVGT